MLDTVAGDIPEAQWVLQNTAAYLRERAQSGCLRPTELPAQREHLEYLSKLMTDPSSTDYADQVSCVRKLMSSFVSILPQACSTDIDAVKLAMYCQGWQLSMWLMLHYLTIVLAGGVS